MRKKKNSGIGKWIIVVIIVALLIMWRYIKSLYNAPIRYDNQTITIEKGDTITKFFAKLSWGEKNMMKLWLRNHAEELPLLQEGNYQLDWTYTKQELLDLIAAWPQKNYIHVTVLEARSKYDIDAMLTEKNLISQWEYIAKVENQIFINSLKEDFPFLQILPQGKSLEGFLYPDTYFLDENIDICEQLIKAQLKNFDKKIRSIYAKDFEVKGLQLSPYQILILASVIENEEKLLSNKPVIAWIFVNRLTKGMRLDADVTLCYGLKITYNKCRENINANLNDASNVYNTRQNTWLMPTPISSPTADTLNALINYKKTNALYYLHDGNGTIHYAETLNQHNQNKERYL